VGGGAPARRPPPSRGLLLGGGLSSLFSSGYPQGGWGGGGGGGGGGVFFFFCFFLFWGGMADESPSCASARWKDPVPIIPAIDHSLSGGLAVHINKERIFPGRIEILRFQEPRVQSHYVTNIQAERNSVGAEMSLGSSLQLRIVPSTPFARLIGKD